jgi:hypothetical protein
LYTVFGRKIILKSPLCPFINHHLFFSKKRLRAIKTRFVKAILSKGFLVKYELATEIFVVLWFSYIYIPHLVYIYLSLFTLIIFLKTRKFSCGVILRDFCSITRRILNRINFKLPRKIIYYIKIIEENNRYR